MKTEVYIIKGMTCASCSSTVERVTRKMDGVTRSEVNLATNKMTIEYEEEKVSPEDIMNRVERAGFAAEQEVLKDEKKVKEEKEEREEASHKIKRRLIISIVLAVPLLYISMGHMIAATAGIPGYA